jgi:hypothetical protein
MQKRAKPTKRSSDLKKRVGDAASDNALKYVKKKYNGAIKLLEDD